MTEEIVTKDVLSGSEIDHADASTFAWTCAILVLGAVPTILDGTIVTVALPAIARTFSASMESVGWVMTGYLLALALVVPVAGWAMDRFGAKLLWVSTQLGFLAASIACALSWSATSLTVVRVLQGLAGGMVMPMGQAILARVAGPRRLGRAMAIVSIPSMLAPIAGPLLGGYFVDEINWRWVFWINVPLGIAALVVALIRFPQQPRDARAKLDWAGMALLPPGLVCLTYGLSKFGSHARIVAIWWVMAGIVLLVSYVFRALPRPAASLVDLTLLRRPAYSGGTLAQLLLNAALFGGMLGFPLYYQVVGHLSALQAGALIAPQGLGYIIAMAGTAKIVDKRSPRAFALVGWAIAAAASVPFVFVSEHPSYWLLGLCLVFRGIGISCITLPTLSSAYRRMDPREMARASSGMNVLQRIGASLGVAAVSMLVSAHLVPRMSDFTMAFVLLLVCMVATAVPIMLLPKEPASPKEGNMP